MAVICGRCRSEKCRLKDRACDGLDFSCPSCVIVYTGKDYDKKVLDMILSIYEEFTTREIKSKRGYDNLTSRMIICGHHCAEIGDYDDIVYTAGTIVLLQNHKFKWCSTSDKLKAYELIKRLKIDIDKQMIRDYHKIRNIK